MSLHSMLWALNDAPTGKDATAKVILIALGDYANPDGTGAYPSLATLSRIAEVSRRTVQYKLRLLEQLGTIRHGNQRLASHLPGNHRPTVWDLNLPATGRPARRTPAEPHPQDRDADPAPQDTTRGAMDGIQGCSESRAEVQRVTHEPSNPTNNPGVRHRDGHAARPGMTPIGSWRPGATHRTFAVGLGLDCDREFAKFRDACLSSARVSANWDASFRNWLRRGHELGIAVTNRKSAGHRHTHTWRCSHVLALLRRDEETADLDGLAVTLAGMLNTGIDGADALTRLGLPIDDDLSTP
jgi:hypothetical protein